MFFHQYSSLRSYLLVSHFIFYQQICKPSGKTDSNTPGFPGKMVAGIHILTQHIYCKHIIIVKKKKKKRPSK